MRDAKVACTHNHDTWNPNPIGPDKLQGLFVILVIGITAATMVFMTENITKQYRNKITKT